LLAAQDAISAELRARLKRPETEREPGSKAKALGKELGEMKELMVRKERDLIGFGSHPILAIDKIS